MTDSLVFFLIELGALFLALFFTLKIRPGVLNLAVGISVILIPAFLCYVYIVNWLGVVYFMIAAVGVFYFQAKTYRVFLDVSILTIAIIISDTLVLNIKFMFLIEPFAWFPIFSQETLTLNTMSIFLFFLIFGLLMYFYDALIRKAWDSITIASQLIVIIIAWVTVTALSLNLFISLNQNLYYPAIFNLLIQTIYFALMLILSILLLRNIKKDNRMKRNKMEQEQLLEYMEALERINNDMQRFRHDYNNILLTMQGYINNHDIQGLKTYFKNRIAKVEHTTMKNNHMFNQLNHIKLVELKGLLSTKVLIVEELNIQMHVEIPEPIETIKMNIIDLTRLIGILVDNAIEASISLEQGVINMALLKKSDESLLMVIENRINDEKVDKTRLFEPGYSTKTKNEGVGLVTVRKIIGQYPNVTMNTRIEPGLFIHEIEINNNVVPKKVSRFHMKVLS